jgi:hypothetical protein
MRRISRRRRCAPASLSSPEILELVRCQGHDGPRDRQRRTRRNRRSRRPRAPRRVARGCDEQRPDLGGPRSTPPLSMDHGVSIAIGTNCYRFDLTAPQALKRHLHLRELFFRAHKCRTVRNSGPAKRCRAPVRLQQLRTHRMYDLDWAPEFVSCGREANPSTCEAMGMARLALWKPIRDRRCVRSS